MAWFTTNFPIVVNAAASNYVAAYYETLQNAPPASWELIVRQIPPQNLAHFTRAVLGTIPMIAQRGGPLAPMAEAAISERYLFSLTPTEYANRVDVPKKQWPRLPDEWKRNMAIHYARAIQERVANRAWSIINDATTALGPDGKALAADDHPREDGGVVDNLTNVAFSAGALGTVLAARMNLLDPQGKIMTRPAGLQSYVVANPVLAMDINTAVKASWRIQEGLAVGSTGSDYNPFQELLPLIDAHVSSTNRWAVVDAPTEETYGLLLWMETPPALVEGDDLDEDRHWMHVSCEVAKGFGSYYDVYLSQP
jgi:hypothetical protein